MRGGRIQTPLYAVQIRLVKSIQEITPYYSLVFLVFWLSFRGLSGKSRDPCNFNLELFLRSVYSTEEPQSKKFFLVLGRADLLNRLHHSGLSRGGSGGPLEPFPIPAFKYPAKMK